MPAILDPDRTFELCLARHENLPADRRPVFIGRYLTGRDELVIEERIEKWDDASKVDQLKMMFDVFRIRFCGWRNVGIDWDPERVEDVISSAEAMYLCTLHGQRNELTDAQQKNFDSPSSSDGAGSAASAAGDGVSMSRRNGSLPSSTAPDATGPTPSAQPATVEASSS